MLDTYKVFFKVCFFCDADTLLDEGVNIEKDFDVLLVTSDGILGEMPTFPKSHVFLFNQAHVKTHNLTQITDRKVV